MPKYMVRTGDLERITEAADHESAFLSALDEEVSEREADGEESPKLGRLVETIEVVGEQYYSSTEAALKRAGRWSA